jgi:hypothetical protein
MERRTPDSAVQVGIPVSQIWSHRLVVRTLASHAGNRGSTPRGTTNSYFISIYYNFQFQHDQANVTGHLSAHFLKPIQKQPSTQITRLLDR